MLDILPRRGEEVRALSGLFVTTGLQPVSSGTAGCGSACPVVWDPWLIEKPSVSYGNPIRFLCPICLQD